MIVSSQLFEAYLECSTKCWLRSRAEPATGNFYAEWARPQNETYLEYGLKRSFATAPESDRATAPPIPNLPKEVPRLCRGGSRSLTFTAVVHR